MIDNYFGKLPILKSFNALKINDNVYSKKYGLGQVRRLYDKQVIVQFSNLEKRFPADGEYLSKVPDKYFKRQKIETKVRVCGIKISLPEYKRKLRIEKKCKKIRSILDKQKNKNPNISYKVDGPCKYI